MKKALMRPAMYIVSVMLGFVMAALISFLPVAFIYGMMPGIDTRLVGGAVFVLVWLVVSWFYIGRAGRKYQQWYGRGRRR